MEKTFESRIKSIFRVYLDEDDVEDALIEFARQQMTPEQAAKLEGAEVRINWPPVEVNVYFEKGEDSPCSSKANDIEAG